MRIFKFSLVLLSICLFIFACTQTETTKNTPAANNGNKIVNSEPAAQPTAAQNELASAKKLYTEKCARCHKEDGSGGKTEIDGQKINAKSLISDHIKKDPDSEYIEAIENGFPEDGMPAFKGKLTEQEIKDIIKYIHTELQK